MESNSVKRAEDHILSEKIIIFLNKEEFIQYIRVEKKWFFRSVNSKYNEKNIFPEKIIELKLSDNNVSITGKVGEVYVFDNFNQFLGNSKLLELLPKQSLTKNETFLVSEKENDLNQKVILFKIILNLPDYSDKFVITGGPGFGKTTLLKELEKLGYYVFHEAARAIIEEQEKSDNPIFPWKDRIKFDYKVIKKMLLDYWQEKSTFSSFCYNSFGSWCCRWCRW